MNEDDRRRIRLHDLDRQAVRIDEALDIAPADAGLHPDQALRRLERQHPVHRAQIEVQAAGARGVAAHAEMPPPSEIGSVVRVSASCSCTDCFMAKSSELSPISMATFMCRGLCRYNASTLGTIY
jgi:hypothetical protein